MNKLISDMAEVVEAVYTHPGSLKTKNKINKSITIFLLFIVFIILNTGNSKAVLQANGNAGATYDVNEWMMNVRRMESLGGAMGLSEGINANLTANGNTNNIDVHMQKNTEYGALVILSASSYGKPDKVNNGQTTTGNVTGALMRVNGEWVAAGTISKATNYANAKARYKNIQTTTYTQQYGDAITETKDWYGSGENLWLSYSGNANVSDVNMYAGLVRAYNGSIFSYNGMLRHTGGGMGGPSVYSGGGYYMNKCYTRAVIVSGEGL